MGAGAARAVGNSCLGRVVILVLLRANSRRSVCADSGSNLTPHCVRSTKTRKINHTHTYTYRNALLYAAADTRRHSDFRRPVDHVQLVAMSCGDRPDDPLRSETDIAFRDYVCYKTKTYQNQ